MTEIPGWLWGSYCEHPLTRGAVTCTPALLCLPPHCPFTWPLLERGQGPDKLPLLQVCSPWHCWRYLPRTVSNPVLQVSSLWPACTQHMDKEGFSSTATWGSTFKRAPFLPDVSRPQGTSAVSPPNHVLGNTSTHTVHLLCLELPGLTRSSATEKDVFSLQS